MMALRLALGLAAITTADASRHVSHSILGREEIESVPMHLYRQDCWKKRAVVKTHKQTLASALRGAGYALAQNLTVLPTGPGAGLGEIVPFETVQKDGFYLVECVSDYMFSHGDKFGDNKHSYEIGGRSNVSIVLYEREVPKEDREDMSHAVCFAFCRTVPGMSFFGILNGRECYCTPFYEREESDSSQCDATCEGKPSEMCGGKSKSSIFGMHMCSNTKEDLNVTAGDMTEVEGNLNTTTTAVFNASTEMQAMAEIFQASFGKVGDPDASALMQKAKVFAGDLEKAAQDGNDTLTTMGGLNTDATDMANWDFTTSENITKAEKLVRDMSTATRKGGENLNELDELLAVSSPGSSDEDSNNTAKTYYYPVMYFVDKENKDMMATCSGEAVDKPMVGSKDDCAMACNNQVHDCAGFNYFEGNNTGLCFLLSNFKTAQVYTNCSNTTKEAVCMAKFSMFEGTSLKPKGNGKCKECFKKVTMADRCY